MSSLVTRRAPGFTGTAVLADDSFQDDFSLSSLRGLFLVDREGIVRHSVVNDLALGRSVDDYLSKYAKK